MRKSVDVLYVHPTRNFNTTLYSFMPIGVFGLMNILEKEGFSLYGINYGIEKSLDKNYSLEEEIKNINYKVLMIDLHWYEHCFGAVEIAKLSKSINKDVPIVIGGMTSTIFSKEILENFDCFDYILKGDSEKPLSDLINYLVKGNGNVSNIENICYRDNGYIKDTDITYCCTNLDEIDYVNDSFLKNHDKYLITNTIGVDETRDTNAWLYIGRGCKYNCVYCDCAKDNMVQLFGRSKMNYRSPEKVAQDIIDYASKGIEVVRATHDLEMMGKDYYKKVFSIVKESGVKIGFNYDAFQLPSIEFINILKETFIEDKIIIDITLLSGNEGVRNKMGKLFSNERLYKLLDYLKDTKIITRVYYSINVMDETLDVFNETFNQINDLVDKYRSDNFYICYQRVIMDPIATMRGLKESEIYVELNSFMDYYKYCENDNYSYIGYKDNMSEYYEYKMNVYDAFKEYCTKIGFYNLY